MLRVGLQLHSPDMLKMIWLLSVLVLVAGCGDVEKRSVINKTENRLKFDFGIVKTAGERSYIPLNIDGSPNNNVQLILEVLNAFEEKRKVKILNWKLLSNQASYATSSYIYGIWVDHTLIPQ